MIHLPRLSKLNYVLLGGSLLLVTTLVLAASIGLKRSDPGTKKGEQYGDHESLYP